MPFELYGDVILTRDVADHGLRAGDLGTVVERHVVPGIPEEGYSARSAARIGACSSRRSVLAIERGAADTSDATSRIAFVV